MAGEGYHPIFPSPEALAMCLTGGWNQ
jgi:hypothetical protein